jgi:hypothetical protein
MSFIPLGPDYLKKFTQFFEKVAKMAKSSPKCCHFLATTIFKKNHDAFSIVAQLAKNYPIWSSLSD